MISIGCSTDLAHLRDMKVETSSVESLPVVCEFPDVFSANFLGLLLVREIDFAKMVELGSKPISLPPY